MNRRTFLKAGVGIGATVGLGGLYSWQIEPYWLEFVQLNMPIKNLPIELDGKTLMQISDIHVGNRFSHKYLLESFQKAKAFLPDFVMYTGDYTHFENEEQYTQLENVLKSAVLGKIGTLGILGNHDYGHGWSMPDVADKTTEILEKTGIKVLRDQKTEIEGLVVYGFEDLWGLNFRPERIMQTLESHRANLVLCHNPDACDLPVWNGFDGWILAGHTHGGQIKPPFLPPPILPVKNRKYDQGIIDLDNGRTLYINRALGHLVPVRLNVRPEITLFTLSKA